MKFLKHIFVIAIIFSSCKTKKNVVDSGKIVKGFTAKLLSAKHSSADFNKKTIDAKLKVNFVSPKDKFDFSVQLKMKKDEVIYLKGTKFITVFKAKITPNKVQFYSPLKNQYFDGDFSMLRKFLGTNVNFEQLQNMLLGQAMLGVDEEQIITFSENKYQLKPKSQSTKFDIFYFVNPTHFKLDHQILVNPLGRLDIAYPQYLKQDGELFPENIKINAKDKQKSTQIDMKIRSVTFGGKLSMPFKIPLGYKEIKL